MTTFEQEYAKFQNPTAMVMDYLRGVLRSLLADCNENQRAFFDPLYPEGIDALPEWRLKNAIDQCQRTIAKNRVVAASSATELV